MIGFYRLQAGDAPKTEAEAAPSGRSWGAMPPSTVNATPDAWERSNHFRVE